MKSFSKPVMRRIITIFLTLNLFSFLNAQISHPSLEPLFPVTGGSKNYTADQVFEMGLLFSECQRDSDDWNRCWVQFEAIKEEVSSEEFMSLGEEERGKAILKLLYRDYLAAYKFSQTRINVAMDKGFYNCVSSAVLYMAAAKAAGLDVRGQRTTQHAFCSIYVPDYVSDAEGNPGQLKKIDVETTNPYGFNPGSKEEIENESKIKKYYVVPKKYYSNRSEISDGFFTGLIAGNLCSDYIKTSDYQKAVPLGAARWEAVRYENPDAVAFVRNEFDILAGNYVNLKPEKAETYSSTLDWFYSFIERWGNDAFLQKNLDNSFINLLVLCNKEQNYLLAKSAYEKYIDKVSQSQHTKAEEIMTDIIILTATNNLSSKEKVAETNRLLATKELASDARQKRGKQHLELFWITRLNELMKAGEYIEGYADAGAALEVLPKSSKIKNMQNSFYNNLIAILHNGFARYANAGDYETARAILIEGLKKFPEDRTLKRDLADIDKLINSKVNN